MRKPSGAEVRLIGPKCCSSQELRLVYLVGVGDGRLVVVQEYFARTEGSPKISRSGELFCAKSGLRANCASTMCQVTCIAIFGSKKLHRPTALTMDQSHSADVEFNTFEESVDG